MPSTETTCLSSNHDFVIKRQIGSDSGRSLDVTEVYCRKCGTVCILSQQPEPAVITLPRGAN